MFGVCTSYRVQRGDESMQQIMLLANDNRKTSDLIPLCHPLPLDRVNINIQLINNQAIIECECRVTHKTGVEMEALTGATVAALTIYDMVKAVSHRVEIGQTVLVSKSGGKSDFVA